MRFPILAVCQQITLLYFIQTFYGWQFKEVQVVGPNFTLSSDSTSNYLSTKIWCYYSTFLSIICTTVRRVNLLKSVFCKARAWKFQRQIKTNKCNSADYMHDAPAVFALLIQRADSSEQYKVQSPIRKRGILLCIL